MKSPLDRARKYLEKMPPAHAGQSGDRATYNAAVVLVRGFALAEAEALPLLQSWNQTHCSPAWTEAELRAKIRSAGGSRQPLGYLVEDDAIFTASPRDAGPASHGVSAEQRRRRWPAFQPLERTAIQRIADLRGLPFAVVDLAARLGYLTGAVVDGHRCFILHEGVFAQARRLDGQPFQKADGGTLKAKNLPGSEGAFIGRQTLGGPTMRVLVIEGVIGLLEALAARELGDPADDWTVLAATSAGSRFARSPDLLGLLRGCRVRIVPDGDASGRGAAAAWLGELDAAGALVDVARLPPGCKDLAPLVSPASASRHADFFTALFQ